LINTKHIIIASLLVIFSIGLFAVPQAFADATVYNAAGSSTPGCEDTNNCFIPSIVTISVGETVTWANTDTAAHTATSGSAAYGADGIFDSSLMMAGGCWSHTFDTAGTYGYHCAVHPWMEGSVIVSGEESTSAPTYTISVSTDKTNYLLNDTVQITIQSTPNQDVSIVVKSANGNILTVNQLSVSASGFAITSGWSGLDLGTYTIEARILNTSTESQTTFTVAENPNTVYNALGSASPGCEPNCFIPTTITVNVGDSVTFANTDTAAHTATSGSPSDGPSGVFDSSLIMAGGSYSITFDEAGTYDYFCMVHTWMSGTVIVGDGGSSAPVLDTVPPTVLVPDDITLQTEDQNGASATFNPQAIDNIDELITPSCNYSSGSVFPIGTTEVVCTATDSSGNTASNSFNVIIEYTGSLIPEWVKNVAGFWHDGSINDASFLEGISYLIQNNIVIVPTTESGSGGGAVPDWVKNTAGWWANDEIDDDTFVNAITYLIQQGLIQV